jgi:uncharacterized protein
MERVARLATRNEEPHLIRNGRPHRPPSGSGVGVARGRFVLALLLALLVTTTFAFGCGAAKETTTTTARAVSTTAPAVTTTAPAVTTTSEAKAKFPATVTAQGLAYQRKSNGEVAGSVIDFTVKIDKQAVKKVAVGVSEGEVAGTGDMWRAAAWTAPLVATDMLNLDLADYSVDYEVSGRIDGPSAGALMTIATIAAFIGDELKSDVTMTGTINPDYTIGPVGGIPQKLEGAAAAGKKTVLVPLGERYDYDMKSNQMVDLVQRGTDLGLTVKEVANIYEAYPYFTGKEMPKSEATGGGTPAIASVVDQKLKECIQSNAADALRTLESYQAQSAEAQDANSDFYNWSNDALDKASKYMAEGSMGAAYGSSQLATNDAYQAWLRAVAYDHSDWEDLALRLKGLSPEKDVSQLATKLVATSPTTVDDASCLIDAWSSLTSARVAVADANQALEQITTNFSDLSDDDLSWYMGQAISGYVYCMQSIKVAEDDLKLAEVSEGAKVASPDRIGQLSEAYRRAAEANLAMLDSTVIPQKAEEWGVSEQDAKFYLAGQEVYYHDAGGAVNEVQALLDELPDGAPRDYAVLGASLNAFTSSAASIALNYDYGAEYDSNGAITGFTYDKPLSRALDLARTEAETSMALVAGTSDTPVIPWIWYELANRDREGTAADKINALYYYWNAHAQARTLLAISGGATPLIQ